MSRERGRVEIKRKEFWSTPMWFCNLSENNTHPTKTSFNEDLIQFIIGEAEKSKENYYKSNRGGWQSRTDLYDEPALHDLGNAVYNVVKTSIPETQGIYFQQMWAAVNKRGNWNAIHQHGNYQMSGAYYLQVPENSGEIVFRDPRPCAISNWVVNKVLTKGEFEKITPKESDLMIWPAFLDHFVEPSESDQDRIMISFDFNIKT